MKIIETHIVPVTFEKLRLQEYAATIFKSVPTRSGIKKAIKRKEILIDGKVAKTSNFIQQGQKIELLETQEKQRKAFPLKLEVIFEDEDLAVINKPAGYPTSGNYFKTIENALPFNLKISNKMGALVFPAPVHRLDNPTSGLLLIAKTRPAQIKLNRAFQNKEIRKTYVALVIGKIPEDDIFSNKIEGKIATTEIRPLKYFKVGDEDFSLVTVSPKTGRTHQIRIHLAQNNFPILGDRLYGGLFCQFHHKGLFLAATGLQFNHPRSNKEITLELGLPRKFRKIKNLINKNLPQSFTMPKQV